jgi:GTP diphosphokinase / guanosine-3',5'-bis(diphosphate) 3'-diphosphatase
MAIDDLIQSVTSYADLPETEEVLTTAYEIAERVHRGFRRLSGDPAISHTLAVASILAEWRAPLPVVAVGLLHDIHSPDYSHGYDLHDVKSVLGEHITRLLSAVIDLNSSVRQIERYFDREGEVETNLRYVMSVAQEEPDAVVIKLADRLHNLQTIVPLSRYYQERMARIGFNVLIPLADQLGMAMVKRSLEDYSFKVINPSEYRKIEQQYANADSQEDIEQARKKLLQSFAEQRLQYGVRWQPASLYTLHRRQIEQSAKQGKSLRTEPAPLKMLDTGWLIVLTRAEEDCYHALGLVHKLYQPIKGQFRDLIADGKENGYRALHTQVRNSSGNSLPIFIRTHDMDIIAERGITARWWDVPGALLPQLARKSKPIDGEIQVFTSESEVRYLPQGSTVLDFAYNVHTEVGHSCAGALVNGEQLDAFHPLQHGDRVELIKGDTQPDLNWLNHVRTSQASGAIRQWLLQRQYSAMIDRGRILLDQQLQPSGLNAADPQVGELLNRISAKEAVESQEDLLAAIGVGRLDARKLADQLRSLRVGSVHLLADVASSLSVRIMSSEEALLFPAFARCCRPVPFDEILAIRSNDKVIVHKRTCARIGDVERPILVEWDTEPIEPHYVAVVEALNRPGLAHDLTAIITQSGLDMSSFTAYKRPDGVMAESHIYLGKTTATQRARVQKALETVPYVTNVEVLHSSLFVSMTEQPSASSTYRSNPYSPGVAKGHRFYGRKLECERLMTYLCDCSQNHAILLWGQKRIGKTSLVVRVQEQAQRRFLPVYIDMQAVKDGTSTQFLHLLMNRISLALREFDASQEISVPAFKHLKREPLGYFDSYLSQVQQAVEHCPLVIILDEFQCLCTLREIAVSRDAIFSRLRSQSLHGRGVHLILSGGGLLSQLLEQTGIVSLLHIAHDEKLATLEMEAARELIKDGLTEVGSIADGAIEYLLQVTAGHPYYLQLLCSHLYEKAQEQRVKITRDFVASCTRQWIEQADNSRFQHFWEGYDKKSERRNKLILSAIADCSGQNDEVEYEDLLLAIGNPMKHHLMPEQELVRALDDLTNLGVLKHVHSRYTIEVKLFTHWLRQHWPLTLTMKEGDWV